MTRLTKAKLAAFQELLRKKREELSQSASAKKVSYEDSESRRGDWIDQSSEDNSIYINIHLLQTDTKLIRAIDSALARIDAGTFGICTACKEPIAEARLNAVPWARVCIKCKEKQGS